MITLFCPFLPHLFGRLWFHCNQGVLLKMVGKIFSLFPPFTWIDEQSCNLLIFFRGKLFFLAEITWCAELFLFSFFWRKFITALSFVIFTCIQLHATNYSSCSWARFVRDTEPWWERVGGDGGKLCARVNVGDLTWSSVGGPKWAGGERDVTSHGKSVPGSGTVRFGWCIRWVVVRWAAHGTSRLSQSWHGRSRLKKQMSYVVLAHVLGGCQAWLEGLSCRADLSLFSSTGWLRPT